MDNGRQLDYFPEEEHNLVKQFAMHHKIVIKIGIYGGRQTHS